MQRTSMLGGKNASLAVLSLPLRLTSLPISLPGEPGAAQSSGGSSGLRSDSALFPPALLKSQDGQA